MTHNRDKKIPVVDNRRPNPVHSANKSGDKTYTAEQTPKDTRYLTVRLQKLRYVSTTKSGQSLISQPQIHTKRNIEMTDHEKRDAALLYWRLQTDKKRQCLIHKIKQQSLQKLQQFPIKQQKLMTHHPYNEIFDCAVATNDGMSQQQTAGDRSYHHRFTQSEIWHWNSRPRKKWCNAAVLKATDR